MADLAAHHEQMDSADPIRHFHEECLRNCKRRGKRFLVNPVTRRLNFQDTDFYLDEPLQEYFQDTARVRRLFEVLLPLEDQHKVQPEKIAENYVQIFAILIVIGQGKWIRYFIEHQIRDGMLPIRSEDTPDFWPAVTYGRREFWEAFRTNQWPFCPHQFEITDLHTKVEPLAVLPLKSCEILNDSNWGTIVYKVEIYPGYHRLYSRDATEKPKNAALHNLFVIKSLDGSDSEHYHRYEQEVSAFKTLDSIPMPGPNKPSDEIVRCYGSFVQNNTYNILLEYADQGTLVKYFETVSPPITSQQMQELWLHLGRIAAGVFRIHQVLTQNDSSHPGYIHQGYHQDLKPANILVFSNGEQDPYRFTFKIADLGLSYFLQRKVPASDPQGPAEVGSRTFGSPDKYGPQNSYIHPTYSGQASDIWSLGCIFSVVSTWMVSGKEGIQQYATRRREARQNLSKSLDCFHDDEKVLDEVKDWHDELIENARKNDTITEKVYGDILSQCFHSDHRARFSAFQLHNAIKNIFKPIERRTTMRETDFGRGFQTPKRVQSRAGTHARQNSQSSPQITPARASQTGSPTHLRHGGRATSPDVLGAGIHEEPDDINTIDQYGCDLPAARGVMAESPVESLREIRQNQQEPPPLQSAGSLSSRQVTIPTPQTRTATTVVAGDINQHHPKCPQFDQKPREPPPHMSVEELFAWKERRDRDRSALVPDSSRMDALRNHDHVFIVDDSVSMKPHWNELSKLFGAFAKLVKDCDPDGAELYTTSKPEQPLKASNSTPLYNRVHGLRLRLTVKSQPERVMRKVLDDYRERVREGKAPSRLSISRQRSDPVPLCVYMFTDGVWQPDTDLTKSISDWVNLLEKDPPLPEYHVGIQFIRFGSDAEGIARLDRYDRLGKNLVGNTNAQQHGTAMLRRDIVDTEPSNGNVWKMLLGAVNKWFDDDDACTCGASSKHP